MKKRFAMRMPNGRKRREPKIWTRGWRFMSIARLLFHRMKRLFRAKIGSKNFWKGFLDSLSSISWKTTRVEVSKSGDMASTTGTYEMTMKDGTKDHGKYCEVWEKKSGAWKVGIDMFSSDLLAPGSSPSPAAG